MCQTPAICLRRWLIGLTTAVLVTTSSASEQIQGPAPDFALKSNSGSNLRLSELRGEVVMINFWASWCGPCRQEMPLLNEIHQRYKPLGFTVLGVNVEEDSNQAKALLKQVPVSFPILFDNDSTVSKLYDVSAMPSTVLIDRDGNMRYLHRGYKPGYEQEYAQQVRALVRE
jgi:thiol-disulfide isomerase/thioredoxin